MRLLTFAPFPRRRPVSSLAALLLLLTAVLVLANTAGPAQAQTTGKLVGNTGQTSVGTSNFLVDRAQSFTTGSSNEGYKLTRVDVRVQAGTGTAPTFTVTVRSDSSSRPGTSQGTLTQQGNFPSTAGQLQFNAAGTGIDLSANTTYWILIDVSARDPNEDYQNFQTAADNEDSGGAAGWSMGDSHVWRTHTVTNWPAGLGVDDDALLLDIYGYDKNTAPTVANAIPDRRAVPGTAFSYAFPANTFADAGDTLTYTAKKSDDTPLPSWLTFTASTRTFSGTPQAANVGTLSVKVTASDGMASVSDTFDIVVNAAPTVASAIPDQRARVATAFSYTFPANTFADANGDTLTYTATRSNGTALPSWLTFTAGTRTFSGTAQAANVETLSVKVTASDGFGGTVSDTFDIVVRINISPTVANALLDTTVLEGRVFLHTFPANTFDDADGDTLTYTATLSNGTPLVRSWLNFTPSTRTFYGKQQVGTLSVRVTASDGIASVSDTFNIVVKAANSAPTVQNRIPDQSATTGTAFSYTFPSSTFAVATSGNALSYTATRATGSPLPSWLTFDAGTRTFSGTPQAGDVGRLVVRVTASDGTESVSDIFDIVVAQPSTTPLKLVGNTGQTPFSTGEDTVDFAQAFTTGTNPAGYTLTEVQIDLPITGSSLPEYAVEIWSANSSDQPTGSGALATLMKPSALTNGLNSFTHPGFHLEPSTNYAVLVNLTSPGSSRRFRDTQAEGEDTGGASGWSIGSQYHHRGRDTSGPWIGGVESVKIAVHGYVDTGARVIGKTLTLRFDVRLQEDRVPVGDAFRIILPDFSRNRVSDVSISGKTVTLTLEKPIGSHVKWAAVAYHPGDARGPDNTGSPLAKYGYVVDPLLFYFSRNVSILSPDTPPVVQRLTVGHSIRPENQHAVLFTSATVEDHPVERWSGLGIAFNEPVDPNSLPAGSAFRVTARAPDGGSVVTVSGTDTRWLTSSKVLWMRLAEPVARNTEATVSYVKPSTNPLRDLTGNELESFSGMAAKNSDRGLAKPEVVSVAVVSDPGSDRTYRRGEEIQVQVTFSGDVLVSGEPRLRLSMGREHPERSPTRGGYYRPYAYYGSGDGTRTLTFGYTVRELDRSPSIAVDRLELNGGAISSWAHPGAAATNPDLSQVRLGYDANHQVGGSLPVFQSATVDGTALTLTFTETLDTASVPAPVAFHVTVNNARRNVASGGVAISGATVTLTLASAVVSGDTVKVRYTKPSANPLQSAYGVAVDTFPDQAVTNNRTQVTIWSSELTVRNVAGEIFDGCSDSGATSCTTGLTSNTFALGDETYQVVEVGFLRSADKTHASVRLDKAIPASLRTAAYLYVGNRQLSFAAASFPGDGTRANWTTSSIVFLQVGKKVSLRLTAPPGSSGGSGGSSAQTIPPSDPNSASPATRAAPAVTGVEVTSDPGTDDTYGLGDVIQVTLTFSEAVDVTGTPRLKIDMDPAEWGEKWAAYDSGSGTASLTFAHTVVEPNISTQGIAVLANTLELNGGDIELKDTDDDADLSHDGLSHDSNHKVDWQEEGEESGGGGSGNSDDGEGGAGGQDGSDDEQSEPASVSGVAVSSSPQANATYKLGETIQVTLTFDEAVDVTGTPRLKIDMDPADWGEKWAAYASGSGTASLTFTHTVVEPNISTQGIAVLENTLELNGGTIRSDDTDAGLSHTGLAHNSNHKVDWRPETPEVDQVEITSDPESDDTYGPDEVITVSVTFDEAVDVDTSGGTPRLKIDMDPADWGEKWAGYASGSGTTTITFTHTVVKPNISTQGIAVLEDTLELNGGTIVSTDDSAGADLSHTGLNHDAKHKVDWEQSEPPANSAATGAPAITGTARVGETLTADTSGIADADGLTGASFSYQWLADSAAISGATGSTYAPATADVGKAVKVRVSFTDDAGHAETLTSAATAAIAAKPPEVTGVAVTSNPGSGDTYGLGEVIRISVTFDEAVDVTGAPQIAIDMDPAEWGTKQAAYESGSGTTTLVFAHTVVEPNISTQGIAVLANTLALNGGDIESKATDTDADLSHTGLAHDAKHKVDWQQEEEGQGS